MDSDRPRRPTLDTVASAVGVSRATVSNAYNRPDQLSASLRTRILETARSLGYAGPDPVARSLATRRNAAVGLMLPQGLSVAFTDPSLSIVLDGLASTVDGHDHCLVLMPGNDTGGPRPETVSRAQADVVVAYSLPDSAPALSAVSARGLPLVVIDQPVISGTARVEVDDSGGARLAASHLLALGHSRFGILTFALHPDGYRGPVSCSRRASIPFRVSRDRLTGYLDALENGGVAAENVPVWEASGSGRELGREGARWMLTRTPRPSALLCASDQLAFGALQAARDLGLSVPGDVSVVGFDDVPEASVSDPPLTTVRQPLAEKGRLAGQLALKLLAGARPPRATRLDVSLISRASCAPSK
ncbi:LacI family DNA-binding transcriptional regulator [Lentzea tibetensis]|uniref:LacI family DNA-binding transcriptional regulator n=1 Tax=Lentzea tibetensis TaxID=2591470 RepID=A0A563EVZ9_9PSEU|nr:LacI family DNA-binding transcriptional regulator [Lentzea tibetensis]TWP51324.1 LacI family DNA-binding transcriptional regulator [Lentzea tibetensis]